MDKYEVIGSLGEGSFGRVYKAKQLSDDQIVALKVISKRGRSSNEIKTLRGECEIQRHLHHPNIIQMIDSFETDNEIVVITEFAHKELTVLLGEHGYLPEDRVQKIVWDLVSALYYLHSHRVLHRDLKPQNILLDIKNRAKLCDFGFARNMSSGTHVLTSIKGTPLYMAPELIDELPYDHNADLWSLGCIIYELLVGAPPFCTASILHLIRLIKNEQVQWPTFLSSNCISFLKGLLQKDPKKRLTWTEILNHAWVKGNILIMKNDLTMPLTKTLSKNTLHLKDLQRKEFSEQKKLNKGIGKSNTPKNNDSCNKAESCGGLDKQVDKLSLECADSQKNTVEVPEKKNTESKLDKNKSSGDVDEESSSKLEFIEDTRPIDTEEWTVFLMKSINEVMGGEMVSLTQPNLTNILVSPLKNSTTNPKVLINIAKLFSIPFVVEGTTEETRNKIKKVYLQVKLIPNLLYSSKLLYEKKLSLLWESFEKLQHNSVEINDEMETLASVFLLICHLVHVQQEFLDQLCDAIAVLKISHLLHKLLNLSKKNPRLVLDLIAIITLIIKKAPDNFALVEKILIDCNGEERTKFNFVTLLRHENFMMRERVCYLMLFLGRNHAETLSMLWGDDIRETLEALMFDSIESVRNAAERCVDELKDKDFYQ